MWGDISVCSHFMHRPEGDSLRSLRFRGGKYFTVSLDNIMHGRSIVCCVYHIWCCAVYVAYSLKHMWREIQVTLYDRQCCAVLRATSGRGHVKHRTTGSNNRATSSKCICKHLSHPRGIFIRLTM